MRDLASNLLASRGGSPVAITDTTALVSQIIDLAAFDGGMFVYGTGTLADADATFTVLLEEGDESDLSDNAAVADADMVGLETGFIFSDDDEVYKLGYIGSKRYIRLTLTPVANSGSAPLFSVWIGGKPSIAPVVQADTAGA
jgi:hypothetical protein